jgi:hypothetical protein
VEELHACGPGADIVHAGTVADVKNLRGLDTQQPSHLEESGGCRLELADARLPRPHNGLDAAGNAHGLEFGLRPVIRIDALAHICTVQEADDLQQPGAGYAP